MARLGVRVIERVEAFCDRVLKVVEALPSRKVSHRLLDQIAACGTSVGANLFEADEAVSRADFCKCPGIVVKELNETRFWIRLVGRHGWIKPARLSGLEQECNEIRLVLGTMIARTRGIARTKPS